MPWCKYNVASTSMQRHGVASTLRRRLCHDVNITSPQRRCNVMTLHRRWNNCKYNVASTSLTSCALNITSPQRRCNVMTLHRRWGDVIFTSCARYIYVMCPLGLIRRCGRVSQSGCEVRSEYYLVEKPRRQVFSCSRFVVVVRILTLPGTRGT